MVGAQDILSYLQAEQAILSGPPPPGFYYNRMSDFVLREGRACESREPTDRALRVYQEAMREAPRMKECFYNAWKTCLGRKRKKHFFYVEGYALGIIPVHHAWIEVDGCVIDPTWRLCGNLKDHTYFGVQFPTAFAASRMIYEDTCYSLLDDWKRGWPMLKVPLAETITAWRKQTRKSSKVAS